MEDLNTALETKIAQIFSNLEQMQEDLGTGPIIKDDKSQKSGTVSSMKRNTPYNQAIDDAVAATKVELTEYIDKKI